jgi:DNA repair exonuclease SbcCD ATPase subunit
MRNEFVRRIMIALAVLLAFVVCFDEATAQRRRNKRSRRVTNPVATQPVTPAPLPTTQSTDPQIISTADQQQAAEQNNASAEISGQVPANSRRTTRRRASSEPEDEETSMRRTVNELSTQVTKLTDKLSQMEQQQRTLVDLERLSRAEQRAEALRSQLRDVQEKEGAWQARLEQIDFGLKPENIERSVSTYGSTRPEEAREARRRQLESEKTRARTQLELLATSRQRLETAVINADLEVDKLRRRIEEADEAQQRANTTNSSDTSNNPSPTAPSTGPIPEEPPSTPPR